MGTTPNIQAFVCHYTSQQTLAEDAKELEKEGMPAGVTLNRLICTGKLQVSTLLKAFEDGADAVYVVGCPEDKCHNRQGSMRAAKRVLAVKKALEELGVEPERAEMFHTGRGLQPEFIEAAQKMHQTVMELGPCPFKGEEK